MRKYQPAWEQLKQELQISMRADPVTHTRIFRAVRKEKCKDLGYKELCTHQGKRYKLSYKSELDILSFSLIPDTSSKNL